MPKTLGCAQEYRAAIHWRGGGRVYGTVLVDELTEVEWGRTASEVSEAKVKLARAEMSPECCQMFGGRALPDGRVLGGVEPWIHELTLYRDAELVWQGPVVKTTETREGITVEAQDVVGWLEKVVNTWRLSFRDKEEPDKYRVRGPVTVIAHRVLKLNLGLSKLSPKAGEEPRSLADGRRPGLVGRVRELLRVVARGGRREAKRPVGGDWAGILDYVVRQDTKESIRFERDGSKNRAIWVQTVAEILRELTKRGLLFTTVGRSLLLRGKPNSKSYALARLTLADFIGDVEVIRDGTGAATAAWATSQDQQDPSKGRTEIVGEWGTEYGRLDTMVEVTDANADELKQAAKKALEGRYPVPTVISVPDNAQLAPTAPVSIDQLVCGVRLDVVSSGWCSQVQQGFMLSDVSVSWSGGAGEKVGISLVPLSDAWGEETEPPDDQPEYPDGGGGGGPV